MARPVISVQAAIAAGSSGLSPLWLTLNSATVGILGTNTLGDGPLVGGGAWAEIGDYADSIAINRGRQRQLEQFAAGTMNVDLDNTDRRFDPTWVTAGAPYAQGGVSNLVPMRAVRCQAVWAAVTYDLFFGFVDNLPPTHQYPEGGRARLAATDAFKPLAKVDPLESAPAGQGERTGARIGRALDIARWPAALRDLQVGDSTHSATTSAQPVLSQIRLAADSERGDVYVAPDGKITFRSRHDRYEAVRSQTPQWVFGDGPTDINMAAVAESNDDQLLRNEAIIARAGGTAQYRVSDPSLDRYLVSTYQRSDLTLADDVQSADFATSIVYLFADAQGPRVDSIVLEPDGYPGDALWPVVLGARIGDRVTINLRHPQGGAEVWSADYFVEGVAHTIPVLAAGKWQTRFALSPAAKWTNPFRLDVSLLDGPHVLAPY
jgi:hypothetical protein